MTTKTLSQPIPVYNVDGTLNEAGSITEVVDLVLRYITHSERTLFCVTDLGKQTVLLGHTWLQTHNPEIDWVAGTVTISRCQPGCCAGCRDELREERKAKKAEIHRIEKCTTGPMPAWVEDCKDEEDKVDSSENGEDCIDSEAGDQMFATRQWHGSSPGCPSSDPHPDPAGFCPQRPRVVSARVPRVDG